MTNLRAVGNEVISSDVDANDSDSESNYDADGEWDRKFSNGRDSDGEDKRAENAWNEGCRSLRKKDIYRRGARIAAFQKKIAKRS